MIAVKEGWDHDVGWEGAVRAELGDDRRALRLMQIVERLVESAEQSIPQGFGSWSETKAAYRFFENSQIAWPEILAVHRASTVRRAAGGPIVLVSQDTTEINLSQFPETAGLGYLASPKCRGVLLHTCLATTPEGVVLGVIDQQMWVRPVEQLGKRHTRRERSTDQKESQRWLDGLRATQTALADHPQVVLIADSEADIYDLFAEPRTKCPPVGAGQSRAAVRGTRGEAPRAGDRSHCGAWDSGGGSPASRPATAAASTAERALVDAVDSSAYTSSRGLAVDPTTVGVDRRTHSSSR